MIINKVECERNIFDSSGRWNPMKRFKKVLLTLMAPLMAVILSACGTAQSTQSSQSSQSGASDDKLSVVVSINQWSSMAE